MTLRIALFGQAPLATVCLDRLLEAGHAVVGVFAPPDRGRPDPLAERAQALGLPTLRRRYFQKKTGEPIRAALDEYAALEADLNVLASMTSFLPSAITDAPPHRSLCFHPSLLPRFRGGNAMQWQIISGEPEVGVSIFVPDEGVDTGPVVVQKGGVGIGPTDTTGSLFFDKLCPLGVESLVEAVAHVDAGSAEPVEQDEARATFQGLVDEAASRIDLARPADVIDRLVRGCDPQPGAWLCHAGEPLRLYDARLEPERDGDPGTVCEIGADGLVLALAGGALRVGRLRGSAGKEPAAAWAERCGVRVGALLESG